MSSAHHAHGHHDHHATAAEANRQHFDVDAATYDEPAKVETARRIAQAFFGAYPFDEDSTTLMDFACGTGLVSRELAPYTKKIVGVDISQGMVDQYNLRVNNQGISADEMKAIRANIEDEAGELAGQKFDVLVCSVALHHCDAPAEVVQRLGLFLNPGGVLMIADIMSTPTNELIIPAEYRHIVPHGHGFSEDVMKAMYEGAGLGEFTFSHITSAKHGGINMNIFLARGVKA